MRRDILDNTVNLDDMFKSEEKIEPTVVGGAMGMEPIEIEPVEEVVSFDIDTILDEWSYRCASGFPTYGKTEDMLHLQSILDERAISLPFERITEAPKTITRKISNTKQHPIFNAEYLNMLYPKHSKSIMDAYRTYGSKSKALGLFGTATSLPQLLKMIANNTTDPLFKELYKISSVSGAEGGEAQTSGRGGLGKGEVLCVLLTKGGRSGGTSGTDLDSESGRVSAEIKAGAAKNFKVPLAASRITPFESQRELRKFFGLIEEVKDMDEYSKFLETIQNELGEARMVMQDGVYFGKKPTPSDINMTEYNNLRKFFIGCHKYFYKSTNTSDDTLYIDVDSPTDDDVLLQAKLKSPKTVKAIKSKSTVELDVITKDVDAIRTFKKFEYKLKNHPFVRELNGLDKITDIDLNKILQNKYIIFHEPSQGTLNAPIMIDSVDSSHTPKVLGYTLNQVMIGYKP
jgi:hypothetical protein